MSKRKIKNFPADQGLDERDMTTTVSATEATGIMYNPPVEEHQLNSLRDMHSLQATEFDSDLVPDFDPMLACVDPDINCVNGSDDNHASMRPLTAWDRSNGEGAK